MSDFKYKIQKHKKNIILGLSVVFVGVAGLGVYTMVKNSKTQPEVKEETYKDTAVRKAKYIIGANENGNIDLINTKDGKVLQTINLPNGSKYSRSNSLDEVMAYNNNKFYSIKLNKDKLEDKEICSIDENINVKDFKFSTSFIVVNTGKDFKAISIKDKSIKSINVDNISDYVVVDNNLVYAKDDCIYTVDLNTMSNKKIKIGDITEGLIVLKDGVVAINNFGSGKNTTTLLELNAETLNIDNSKAHNNSNVYAVTCDNDDVSVGFLDKTTQNGVDTQSYYSINLEDKTNMSNKKVPLPVSQTDKSNEKDINKDNTVATKGYMYTNKDGNINIFDLRAGAPDTVINTKDTFFMPVLD